MHGVHGVSCVLLFHPVSADLRDPGPRRSSAANRITWPQNSGSGLRGPRPPSAPQSGGERNRGPLWGSHGLRGPREVAAREDLRERGGAGPGAGGADAAGRAWSRKRRLRRGARKRRGCRGHQRLWRRGLSKKSARPHGGARAGIPLESRTRRPSRQYGQSITSTPIRSRSRCHQTAAAAAVVRGCAASVRVSTRCVSSSRARPSRVYTLRAASRP